MKTYFALAVALLLVCGSVHADDRVVVNIYSESLCPDCIDFFYGSFKNAVYTEGFDQICDYTVFPYGNAEQQEVDGTWQFTCQHGQEECYGNLVEVCGLHYLPADVRYKWFVCLEEQIAVVYNWNQASQICANNFGQSADQISTCVKSPEGNQLQHQVADDTEALQPPHKYVPWITVNGQHSTTDENGIIKDMVGYVCSIYKGPVDLPACKQARAQEAQLLYESQPFGRCMRIDPSVFKKFFD